MQILIKMFLVALFSLGLVACEREGPMERTGESIDESVEELQTRSASLKKQQMSAARN
jgi:hypothetical protein